MKRLIFFLAIAVVCSFSTSVFAVPTFQVYSPGAVAGDYYQDQDTWFTTDNPFEILVAGAYGPLTVSLTDVVLLLSVPEGETGTITVTGTNGASDPTLMTTAGIYVPNVDATADIIGVDTGYYDKSFVPDGPVLAKFNNHYPLHDDVSDYLLFDLGSFFDDPCTVINDYNADGGTITPTGTTGQIKTYSKITSVFNIVHADSLVLVTRYIDSNNEY